MANPFRTNSWSSTVADIDLTGSNINRPLAEKLIIPDISDAITRQDPNRFPYIRILESLAKKTATHWKHEWNEKRLKNFRATIKVGSGVIGSAGSTDLQTNESNLLLAGDMLRVVNSSGVSEIMRVTTKTSATVYVVARGQSGTTALASFASADEVIHLGNAFDEASGAPDGDAIDPTPYYNICQFMRDAVEITNQAQKVRYYNFASMEAEMLADEGKKHMENKERAILLGVRHYNGGNRTMGGLFDTINTYGSLSDTGLSLSNNTFDMTSKSFDEFFFDKIADPIFRYGGSKKIFTASGAVISKITTFGKAYLDKDEEASKALGLKVEKIVTAHGELMLIRHRMFDEITFLKSRALVIDPTMINMAEFEPTALHKNIQNPDFPGVKHEYRSDCTLELRNPGLAHFVVTNLDSTIGQ